MKKLTAKKKRDTVTHGTKTSKLEVIGISGKAGSGKDWIANRFLRSQGYYNFSYAWHLKVWLVGKGLATHEEVFVTKPPHVRKLLQEEATERGRMVYGEDIWTETANEWLRVFSEDWGITKFVIPDIRFVNEINAVHKLGGKVIRVEAPKRVAKNGLTPEARNHISETGLDNFTGFDGVIFNDPEHKETVVKQLNTILDIHPEEDDPENVLDGFFSLMKKITHPFSSDD